MGAPYEPNDTVRKRGTPLVGTVRRRVGTDYYDVLFGGSVELVHGDDLERIAADPRDALLAGEIGRGSPYGLRLQAEFLRHAYRYDPMSGLSNARVEPQLHQVFVAHRVTNGKLRPRMILADEVGLGKTIEAGLVLKELRARQLVKRVLIVTPATLQRQWQSELRAKFNEQFDVLDGPTVRLLSQGNANAWVQRDNVICSLDIAWRNHDSIVNAEPAWDLVIFDEAHRVRRRRELTGELKTTKAYALADELKDLTFGLLLLTATPMQLDPIELWSLIELVEPGIFPTSQDYERERTSLPRLNRFLKQLEAWPALSRADQGSLLEEHRDILAALRVTADEAAAACNDDDLRASMVEGMIDLHPFANVLIRNRKAEIGGFTRRRAVRCLVDISPDERRAYARVSEYLRERYAVAQARGNQALGFLMVTYKKMLASSSHALLESLRRRRARLEEVLASPPAEAPTEAVLDIDALEGAEEISDAVATVEGAVSREDAAQEIEALTLLIGELDGLRDSKLQVFAEVVRKQFASDDKLVVFTQFKDTQELLRKRLESLGLAVAIFNGSMGWEEKEEAVRRFRANAQVLVSTEAGGEGRNFQFAHVLVNYDLPWNPMRVEQRIGRLDRIGQKRDIAIVNLACRDTIEERVLNVLEHRVRLFEESVGSLDPILGDDAGARGLNVEDAIKQIAMATPPREDTGFEALERSVEQAVRGARQQQRLMGDFLLDRASLRSDTANALLNQRPLATPEDLRGYVEAVLDYAGGAVQEHPDGGQVVSLAPKLAADLQVRESTVHGAFDPIEALRLEELPFLAFGHALVDRLVDLPFDDGWPVVGVRRLSQLPAGTWIEVVYQMRLDGMRPQGWMIRHFVNAAGELIEEELDRMPDRGSRAELVAPPLWAASAIELSRARFTERVAAERPSALALHEQLKAEETDRANRIFGQQAARLQRLIHRDQDLIARWLQSGTPEQRRAIRPTEGRIAANETRLERLNHLRHAELKRIASRQLQFSSSTLAAGIAVGG